MVELLILIGIFLMLVAGLIGAYRNGNGPWG